MWFAASRWQPEPKEPAEAGQSLPDVPTVAVLPFVNLSGDPKQDYFSDGITEDILTELSRARDLRVLARNTTFQYKGKAVDVGKLGRELGVLMCSKAPSAVVTTASASRPSSSIRRPAPISGRIATTARWLMSSSSRTKS